VLALYEQRREKTEVYPKEEKICFLGFEGILNGIFFFSFLEEKKQNHMRNKKRDWQYFCCDHI
tara:strand:- start:225 stop:413 length:189 start_codon:yes stop_codon:yes gene_type:complete